MSLWRHQQEALDWSSGRPAVLLNMWMGTGKTRIVLEMIRTRGWERVIVFCPLAVVDVWARQAELHCPGLHVIPLAKGSCDRRADTLAAALRSNQPFVAAVNYEAAWRGKLGRAIRLASWDAAICDEIHRVKSPKGKISKFVADVAFDTRHRIGLSGTPLAHSPLDAFAIFRFLDDEIYGTSYWRFQQRYSVLQKRTNDSGHSYHDVIGFRNLDDFRERFHSITYTASKDVLELPPEQTLEIDVELPPAARRIYRELEYEMIAGVRSGIVTAKNALTKLLRLQQLTSGFVRTDDELERPVHDAKARALRELLVDLEGESVVIFCRFVRDLEASRRVAEELGREVAELSGRRKQLAGFGAGSNDAAVVQIRSGAEGIDLTASRVAIYYSLGYSLAEYEQSRARIHRPGQDRPVVYYHLVARDTVDERVTAALRERRAVIESVVGSYATSG